MAQVAPDVGKQAEASSSEQMLPEHFTVPTSVTAEWARALSRDLERATWRGPAAFRQVLPRPAILQILERALLIFKAEPTLVEINPQEASASVTVVGDTHGQMHDVLNMLQTAGEPSESRHYVFNGDYVDRGAWGLEVLLVMIAWKLAFPRQVFLLRGNHETTTCTSMYGFKGELELKYAAKEDVKAVYSLCKKVFALLPLAARIGSTTLVLHGGLFRKPQTASTNKGKNKRKRNRPNALNAPCDLGSLEDLRAAGKGGLDPNGRGSTVVATDVLWSDPVATPGLEPNMSRGVGVIFGPDVTQRFLVENGLKLVLRSHEGPDARFERDDMASMQEGWTTDHVVEAGRLLTVFSAPDYPQFQADDTMRYGNLAAVAVLRGPDWCRPEMIQYAAVLPRPAATACYDYVDLPGSDDEIEMLGSEASQGSAPDLEDVAEQPDTPVAHAEAATSPEATPVFHTPPEEPQAGQTPPGASPAEKLPLNLAEAGAQAADAALRSQTEMAACDNGDAADDGPEVLARVHAPNLASSSGPHVRSPAADSAAAMEVDDSTALPAAQDGTTTLQPEDAQESVTEAEPATQQQSGAGQGTAAASVQLQEHRASGPGDPAEAAAHPAAEDRSQGAGPGEGHTQLASLANGEHKEAEAPMSQAAEQDSNAPIIHQVANPGRELEQAAAQTLAQSGGVEEHILPESAAFQGNGTSLRQASASADTDKPLPAKKAAAKSVITASGRVSKAPWR